MSSQRLIFVAISQSNRNRGNTMFVQIVSKDGYLKLSSFLCKFVDCFLLIRELYNQRYK